MRKTLLGGFLGVTLGIIPTSIGSERQTIVDVADTEGIPTTSLRVQATQDNFQYRTVGVMNNPDYDIPHDYEVDQIGNNIVYQWFIQRKESETGEKCCYNEDDFVENISVFLNDIEANVKDYRIRAILRKQAEKFPGNYLVGYNQEMLCEQVFDDNGQVIIQLKILFDFLDNNPTFIKEFDGKERYFLPYDDYADIQEHVIIPTKRDFYESNFDIHSLKYITMYLWWRKDYLDKKDKHLKR